MNLKKILLLLITLGFFSCNSNIYKYSVSEITSVSVKFENGNTIQGKVNFPIHFNEDYLFINAVSKGKIKIKTSEINEVTYNFPKINITFIKSTIDGSEISMKTKNEQFLQLISKGKINLYKGYNYGFVYTNRKKDKYIEKTDLYFCKRENEKNVTLVYYADNQANENILKEKALNYFLSNESFKNELNTQTYNSEFLINYVTKYNNENN